MARRFETLWCTVDGMRLHARVTAAAAPGRPGASAEAPALVLVHGLGVSSRYFLPLAAALSPYFRVFAPDLPGTGRSARRPRVLDLAELAAALRGWLDAAGLERASFVGNSMGCQVLAELAIRAPERIDRLVFIGPTVDPRWRGMMRQIPRWLLEAVREPIALWPILLRDYLTFGPRRFVEEGRIALQTPLELRLPLISAPTLVIRGERDGFVSPEWVDQIVGLLPRGSSATVVGAAHAANYSAPREVGALVRAFLGEGSAPRSDLARASYRPVPSRERPAASGGRVAP